MSADAINTLGSVAGGANAGLQQARQHNLQLAALELERRRSTGELKEGALPEEALEAIAIGLHGEGPESADRREQFKAGFREVPASRALTGAQAIGSGERAREQADLERGRQAERRKERLRKEAQSARAAAQRDKEIAIRLKQAQTAQERTRLSRLGTRSQGLTRTMAMIETGLETGVFPGSLSIFLKEILDQDIPKVTKENAFEILNELALRQQEIDLELSAPGGAAESSAESDEDRLNRLLNK